MDAESDSEQLSNLLKVTPQTPERTWAGVQIFAFLDTWCWGENQSLGTKITDSKDMVRLG